MTTDRVAAELARVLQADGTDSVLESTLRAVLTARLGGSRRVSRDQVAAGMAEVFPRVRLKLDAQYGSRVWAGVGWSSAGAQAVIWERILESEGMPAQLPDEENTRSASPEWLDAHSYLVVPSPAPARRYAPASRGREREWTAIALRHLEEWSWDGAAEREIWEQYATGCSVSRIAGAYRGERYMRTWRIINRHRRHCGLPKRFKAKHRQEARP